MWDVLSAGTCLEIQLRDSVAQPGHHSAKHRCVPIYVGQRYLPWYGCMEMTGREGSEVHTVLF